MNNFYNTADGSGTEIRVDGFVLTLLNIEREHDNNYCEWSAEGEGPAGDKISCTVWADKYNPDPTSNEIESIEYLES